jgi:type III pantothenate kinase
MLLAIDLSNTGIKLGLYEGRALRARWRIATAREKTADEYAMLLATLCEHNALALSDITDVIVSSVVPALTPVMQQMAQQYLDREAIVVTYQTPLGVRLLVDNPREAGTDRMLSVLAAKEIYSVPAIVIQFGTATSFDVASPEGDFLGGVIAPGLGISAEALARAGAQLFQVEWTAPATVLGKNTIHTMQSGIVYGHAAMVEGIVARLRREMPGGDRAVVIAHGGLADIVASATSAIDIRAPILILDGLQRAYERLISSPADA